MSIRFTITPAATAERVEALDLIFQHLPAEERLQRRANALALIDSGDIPASGLLIVRQADKVSAAMVCIPLQGASALFWPPQAAPGLDASLVADPLVQHALASMQQAGAKIAQAIVSTADLSLTAPMLRCGFRHVTKVQFLRHRGPTPPPRKTSPELSFEAYQPSNQR